MLNSWWISFLQLILLLLIEEIVFLLVLATLLIFDEGLKEVFGLNNRFMLPWDEIYLMLEMFWI